MNEINEYIILCDIGDNISFNIAGESHTVTDADIEKLNYLNRIYRFQFHKPPSKKRLEQVTNAIRKRPEISLRFYGAYSEDEIDWKQLIEIQDLTIDLWETKNLKAVSSLTRLKRLGISKNVKSKVSLSILAPLINLEILFTSISKDIEIVGKLTNLHAISLDEIKSDNLDFLSNLNNLKTVWLSFGSYNDFYGLSRLHNLEKLRILQVRGFDDKSADYVLPKCKSLWALKLENLKHVTKLDFVKQMTNLEYLSIEGVKNIQSFWPLKNNSRLSTITGYNCRPDNKSLEGLEQLDNVSLGDSYSKSEIDRFLKNSIAKNIWIRGNSLKGNWDLINPFDHVD